MEYGKKIWRWMGTPAPIWMNYVVALLVICVLYFGYPKLWSAALPELLATFLGVLIGYTLGLSTEIKFRKFDEDKRKEVDDAQVKKKQEYLLKVLDEEIRENLVELDKLEKVTTYTIPDTFLRTSSWYVSQTQIESFEDFEFIEKIFELYFNIEEMNRSIDYLRRHVFFSVVVSPPDDKNRRFLVNEIFKNSRTLKVQCKEALDLIDVRTQA